MPQDAHPSMSSADAPVHAGAGKTTLIQHVVRELEGVPVAGFVTAEGESDSLSINLLSAMLTPGAAVRGPDGQREGFDVITLQGQRVPLARTAAALQRDCTATMCRDGPSVGRYEESPRGVRDRVRHARTMLQHRYCVLPEFEACVMPELQQWLLSQSTPHSRRVLLVLDEVRERSAAVVPLMCRGANKQVGKMELTSHAFVQAVRQCLDADGIILGACSARSVACRGVTLHLLCPQAPSPLPPGCLWWSAFAREATRRCTRSATHRATHNFPTC